MKMQLPDSTGTEGGGNWLQKPGQYHFIVMKADENPTTKAGKSLDGFQYELSVLAPPEEKGKKHNLLFWHPKLSDSAEQQLRAAERQAAAVIAAGLATHEQLGSEIEINLEHAAGRQLFAELNFKQAKNEAGEWVDDIDDRGRKSLQLAFGNILHVDDPKAKDFPRDEATLAAYPKALRRDPASFEVKKDAEPAAATSASAVGDDSLGDL